MKFALVQLVLFFWLFFLISSTSAKETARIASFNIQNLGPTKMGNMVIAQDIVKIISRYDIVLVEELQDRNYETGPILLDYLNRDAQPEHRFDLITSKRVGRSSGEMEQYAMYYKPSMVEVINSYTYNDVDDRFSREPFVVQLQFLDGNLPVIGFVVIHTKPDRTKERMTVKEIDALADVYDAISEGDGVNNVIIMGDFNADGTSVRMHEWVSIRLRTRPEFNWLIDDFEDTTVTKTNFAYDRIVVAGDIVQQAVLDAKVYKYDEDIAIKGHAMSDNEALRISDHYPVEVTLKLHNLL